MTRRGRSKLERPTREVDYRHLHNPFQPHEPYRPEQIEDIHGTALRVLKDVGVRILLPEARTILSSAGCSINDDDVARFDPDLVASAISTSPEQFELMGANAETTVTVGGDHVAWLPASGVPHASDLDRGKRPATVADLNIYMKLTEHFDVMHINGSGPEPQDVPVELRHLATVPAMLRLTTKHPVVYARGGQQIADGFEMIRIARGLTPEEFSRSSYCFTVINTNSPLQIDIPMAQGIIDFARAGQMACITPFTLAGAMAPITVAGALVQQHAEFLAGLVLHQVVAPGAPVVYGAFTSNVDMKSGAPAFGTPENVIAAFASGQLARHVGIPLRSSMASASNVVDAQAMYETNMAMWGSILGRSNLTIHCAGWMEGGLTVSWEKFIVDCEVLQQAAELMQPIALDDDALAFDAIAAVGQGGHYFGQPHTMERYQTAFYEPIVSDWSNMGTWTENGAQDAAMRANTIWKKILAEYQPPALPDDRDAELADFIERRTREGGAPPVS